MPDKIEPINEGDPLSAAHYDRLVRELRRLQNVSGSGAIKVKNTSSGVQISAPEVYFQKNKLFQVAYDTSQNQGYLIALPTTWGGGYSADGTQPTFAVYDVAARISTTSPTANWTPNPSSGAPSGSFPNYGNSGPRLRSNWTKRGFIGEARYDEDAEFWTLVWVEHVARFINFSYSGTNQTYSFGQPDSNLSITKFWDGLDPTKTTFGNQNETNQIALVNSPDGGFTVNSGNQGTAVWRDDLDNSQFWQYQIIDMACSTS